MNRFFAKLALIYSLLWSVQPAGPIVSVFYCMSSTRAQQVTFMAYAGVIWVLSLGVQLVVLRGMYAPIVSVLEKLERKAPVPDQDAVSATVRVSRFPLQATLMYLGFILVASVANLAVYVAHDIGMLSASSIWGGTIAGSIACPFMVLGTVSLIFGPVTEHLNGVLRERHRDAQVSSMGILPKLVACFVALAVGLAVWLGFAAFYTGINQTIEEAKSGETRLVVAAARHVKNLGVISDENRLVKEAGLILGGSSYYISDREGRVVFSSKGEALEVQRWNDLGEAIRQGIASGRPGALYENVNSRIISWAPLGESFTVGTFSPLSERLPRFTFFFIWSGYFIVVGFAVGLTLGITNVLATSKSIYRVTRVLTDLSEGEGDLNRRLAITSFDEVGKLARGFNRFTDKLYAVIKSIVDTSLSVKYSSERFSTLAQAMGLGIHDLQVAMRHSSEQVRTMSHELGDVASGCDRASNTINQVAAAAEEMASSVQEVAAKSEEARHVTEGAVGVAQNAAEKMSRLGTLARDIHKVTEVITEISEQTNLLALNATIEAARAGEAGKGFAVVANEIKELARQTALATLEIKDRISGIQNSTDETVKDMDSILQVIGSVNEIVFSIAGAVEEQSVTTQEIARNISQASALIVDVNANVGKSSSSSRSISDLVGGVYDKAEGMGQNSSEVEGGSKDLHAIAEQLAVQVSKFKL